MEIKVNNQPRQVAEGTTITDLLEEIPSKGIATAVNGKFVPLEARHNTILSEGDEVIIISAAYGG